MTFKDALFSSNKFVITAEVAPPKGTDVEELIHNLRTLKGKIDAVNFTDNQSAICRASSLSGCKIAIEMGMEPILQMTCRDRNRIALQSDLMGAYILGVRNILAITGDHPLMGDNKEAKPVYDIESVQLLKTIDTLNQGKDMAGNDLKGATQFFQGAVVTPEANPIEPQRIKFIKKVRAGARFFQTQAIYDLDKFKEFMMFAINMPVKILAGIIILKNVGMANFLNKNIPGIRVPDKLIAELKDSGKERVLDTGIDIAARTIRQIKKENICSGVHIMAIGIEDKIPLILEKVNLL